MKVLQKTLVAAGLATAVFATGAAQAATISAPATATVPAYATYIPNNVSSAIVDLPDILVQLGATEALSVDDSVDITLSGGTFDAAVVAANLTNGGSVAVASGGAIGDSSVKFRVTGAAGGGGDLLTITGLTIDASSVPDNGTVTVQVDMKGFVGGESTNLFSSPLTALGVSKQPVYTVAISDTTVGVFEVATGFNALTSATGTTNATTGVSTSNDPADVTVTQNPVFGGTLTGQTNSGPVPAAEPIVGDSLYTISGPMTGVSGIACTACTGSTSAGVASTATTAANAFIIDADNSAAYAVAGALDQDFTFAFAGDTVMSPSAFTINVTTTTDGVGGYTASTIGGGTVASFSRNGSSFATNSFGSKNKLTITDHSGVTGAGGADGAIILTAYDADGAAVTCTGLTIPNVEANATVTIQGADVLAACPGAKRIDGIVNSTTINVTNVKITSDGATMQSGNNAGVIAQ